jgi:hypothetical protein
VTTLDLLRDWIARRSPVLKSSGIKLTVTYGPVDHNPAAAWVDFESASGIAQLIVWTNSEADLVIGDLRTGKVLLNEHREITADLGLDDVERTVRAYLDAT